MVITPPPTRDCARGHRTTAWQPQSLPFAQPSSAQAACHTTHHTTVAVREGCNMQRARGNKQRAPCHTKVWIVAAAIYITHYAKCKRAAAHSDMLHDGTRRVYAAWPWRRTEGTRPRRTANIPHSASLTACTLTATSRHVGLRICMPWNHILLVQPSLRSI